MVRVEVSPPLPEVFGLGKALKTVVLELPFEEGASLRAIFRKLADQHPAFESHANPKPGDRTRSMVIFVDGKVVIEPDHSKIPLHDGAKILLFLPYMGG